MKVLALDLSTKSSGFALGTEMKLDQHGCITASSKDVVKRIIKMRDEVKNIIQQNNIDKIVMQQVRPEANSHTQKVLMWLQAAIVIQAYQINPSIVCQFIGPSSWRAALKIKQGRGVKRQTLKQEDIDYVKTKYSITVNDDEADAIGIFDAYWIKFDNQINWE